MTSGTNRLLLSVMLCFTSCPTFLSALLNHACSCLLSLASCCIAENGHTLSHSHTILRELVTQEPRCFYRMVDAVIRRHAREADVDAVSDDILCLRHPADGKALAVSSSEQQEIPCTGSMDTCSTKDQRVSVDRQCIDQFYLSVALGIVAVAVCRKGGSSYECADQLYMALAMGLMTIAVCTSSSATNSSNGSSTSSSRRHKVLADWRQTHAFLSALLSYRKAIMLLLRGPRPLSMFHDLWKDLSIPVVWFKQEGVLEQFLASPAAASSSGISSKYRGSDATAASIAATVGKASVGTVPSGYGSEKGPNQPTADPDEVAACRMLTLGVLARVLLTYCQLLPFPRCSTGQGKHQHNPSHDSRSSSSSNDHDHSSRDSGHADSNTSKGTGSSSSSSSSSNHRDGNKGGSRGPGTGSSSRVSDSLSKLLASGISVADLPWMPPLALLGVVCYCLLKQLVQEGTCSCNESSTAKPAASPAAVGAAHQKWGGLQLEVPPSLVQQLEEFEVKVQGPLQQEWALIAEIVRRVCRIKKEHGSMRIPLSRSQRQLWLPQQHMEQEQQHEEGVQDFIAKCLLEVLVQLLFICEEVVVTVQIPLGCNNPNCINLEGMSEAAAAKVCSGCHKVHYCSPECIKAHWKEHMPFCM